MSQPARVYVASSWRNPYQQSVVARLRAEGHDVYDFKNPSAQDHGFSWRETEMGKPWDEWSPCEFIRALNTPPAERGFSFDMNALRWCDTCVLVLPCGRSAHLELGWAAGDGKRTAVLILETQQTEKMCQAEQVLAEFGATLGPGVLRGWEPELMYKMCALITGDIDEMASWVGSVR